MSTITQDGATAVFGEGVRAAHWDGVAEKWGLRRGPGRAYHRRLAALYGYFIPPGRRILEIGCGRGDLLSALKPALGVGVDFSGSMVKLAKRRHPELRIVRADAHDLSAVEGPFEAIVVSDLIHDLRDVEAALQGWARLCSPRTRLILNFQSRLWSGPRRLAQALGLAAPLLPQNWLTTTDVRNLLNLAGFETIQTRQEILWPFPLAGFFNRFLVRFWPLRHLALTNMVVARMKAAPRSESPSVSVIIPVRNEAGMIKTILETVPRMGRKTELIFVEGHSKDGSGEVVEREMAAHPGVPARLFRQAGIGKADAVRRGFAEAKGDILMILDADLTVPPEFLPQFYKALETGTGEFINGVRLVYPMEGRAMRPLNLLANKFLGLAFSWLLGQSLKDTLCGTKVLWRADYESLASNRVYFGDFDPFGDFDLLFGAAKAGLKIVDLPVRYRARTYGTTNIARWRHGWLLFRMLFYGARRIKFI
jgi:SAM-dependent methyltransferase